MKKPKIVCVAGSAVLSGLSIAALMGLEFVMMRDWMRGSWLMRVPLWVYGVLALLGVLLLSISVANLYRWYFGQCYRPQAQ
jgi:hypothetical protein